MSNSEEDDEEDDEEYGDETRTDSEDREQTAGSLRPPDGLSTSSFWAASIGGRPYDSIGQHGNGHRLSLPHPSQSDQRADWNATHDVLLDAGQRSFNRRGANAGMVAW